MLKFAAILMLFVLVCLLLARQVKKWKNVQEKRYDKNDFVKSTKRFLRYF